MDISKIKFKYKIGDTIYHRTDDSKKRGLITGVSIGMGGTEYIVSFGHSDHAYCYEGELTSEYVDEFTLTSKDSD